MKNRPFSNLLSLPLALTLVAIFTSCEDKALVEKNEQLRQRVSELEKEAEILKISAGEDPGDQTNAIKETGDELRKTLIKLEELDAERQKLEQAQTRQEKGFRDYQRKYPVE
ncbi:MAG: hypothetical protein P8O22_03605 [Akkermansiaceae bacterium]|nr:hypothetical protein [Akkermansiaceae bacterium]